MKVPPADRLALRDLASKAYAGPWKAGKNDFNGGVWHGDAPSTGERPIAIIDDPGTRRFVAAASPDVLLKLLDDLDDAEKRAQTPTDGAAT